jgi:hypothetical protein
METETENNILFQQEVFDIDETSTLVDSKIIEDDDNNNDIEITMIEFEKIENAKKNIKMEYFKAIVIDFSINNNYEISEYSETIIITNEGNKGNQPNFKLILPDIKKLKNNHTITIKSFVNYTLQMSSVDGFYTGKNISFITAKSSSVYKYITNYNWVKIG